MENLKALLDLKKTTSVAVALCTLIPPSLLRDGILTVM